ncbi:hypothetical protein [Streptomyces inhibens]|uniref:hypothetical protein n=1 Tax=Streptomyces inhibens TaxID=2293571 RepID=UPI001EE76FE4|nr:hypothetical protein [Streptomyces inhibens]UKY53768.1 hypothetical protein KI385_36505 [Streptomyces inhibens]
MPLVPRAEIRGVDGTCCETTAGSAGSSSGISWAGRSGGRPYVPAAEHRRDPPPRSTPVDLRGSDDPAGESVHVHSVHVNSGWGHAHHGTEGH